jgi:hypothetical protein
MTMKLKLIAAALACLVSAPISVSLAAEDKPQQNFSDRILTPPAPATPRINGPRIYGQRPGHPFLYNVPVTGDRPMSFSADGLPPGLKIDARTGRISGVVAKAGEFKVTLHAKNDKGDDTKPLKIVIGDEIALTPPMGWNSWNCWGSQVSQEKVLQSAKGFVDSGLVNHGWQYINIDDAWQGKRGGEFNAIQPNEKFPDMKALCDQIHDMGLKAGIYSTPWVTSYATHIGGSAENPEGTWEKPTIQKKGNVNKKVLPWAIGKYHFATNDARQWAAWGIDYLKYDWNPNELPERDVRRAQCRRARCDHQPLQQHAFRQHQRALQVRQLLAHQWRHSRQLGFDEQERSRRGQVGTVLPAGTLERPGHAGGRLGRMGQAASDEPDAGRAVHAHQPVVPGLCAAADRGGHEQAGRFHREPAQQ